MGGSRKDHAEKPFARILIVNLPFTAVNSSYFIAGPAEQESGATVPPSGRELHPPKSSAFHGALFRQLRFRTPSVGM
jgi:hypothetical protein